MPEVRMTPKQFSHELWRHLKPEESVVVLTIRGKPRFRIAIEPLCPMVWAVSKTGNARALAKEDVAKTSRTVINPEDPADAEVVAQRRKVRADVLRNLKTTRARNLAARKEAEAKKLNETKENDNGGQEAQSQA